MFSRGFSHGFMHSGFTIQVLDAFSRFVGKCLIFYVEIFRTFLEIIRIDFWAIFRGLLRLGLGHICSSQLRDFAAFHETPLGARSEEERLFSHAML